MTRPRLTGPTLGAVAAGGAVGALLRWTVDGAVPAADGFPTATFAVNVVGSLLLALLPALPVAGGDAASHRLVVVALGPGLLGGFTTLSAYAEEARVLLADGRTGLAATYLLGTLAACLVAVHLADRVTTAAQRSAFEDEEGNE